MTGFWNEFQERGLYLELDTEFGQVSTWVRSTGGRVSREDRAVLNLTSNVAETLASSTVSSTQRGLFDNLAKGEGNLTEKGAVGKISSRRSMGKVWKAILVSAVFVSSVFVLVRPASAAYAAVDLGCDGFDRTDPADINDYDQIAATRADVGSQPEAVVYDPASSPAWTKLTERGSGGWESAYAINNNGEVVGGSAVYTGTTQATFWPASHDRIVDLKPVTGGVWGDAYGVNDFSEVVGTCQSPIGDEYWFRNAGGQVHSSPAILGSTVFIGSDTGMLHAFGYDGSTSWTFTTPSHSPIRCTPGIGFWGGGTAISLYVTSEDGYFYHLDRSSGSVNWNYSISAAGVEISSPTVVCYGPTDSHVYVGSGDGYVYALNAFGTAVPLLWRTSIGGSLGYSTPAAAHSTLLDHPELVYIGSTNHHVYALDAVDGNQVWMSGDIGFVDSSPTVANGIVYIASHDSQGCVYALNADTGDLVRTYSIGANCRVSASRR